VAESNPGTLSAAFTVKAGEIQTFALTYGCSISTDADGMIGAHRYLQKVGLKSSLVENKTDPHAYLGHPKKNRYRRLPAAVKPEDEKGCH